MAEKERRFEADEQSLDQLLETVPKIIDFARAVEAEPVRLRGNGLVKLRDLLMPLYGSLGAEAEKEIGKIGKKPKVIDKNLNDYTHLTVKTDSGKIGQFCVTYRRPNGELYTVDFAPDYDNKDWFIRARLQVENNSVSPEIDNNKRIVAINIDEELVTTHSSLELAHESHTPFRFKR